MIAAAGEFLGGFNAKAAKQAARLQRMAIEEAYRAPKAQAPKEWKNVGDFWNDPRRWDGIDAGSGQAFWSVRRSDLIDIRGADLDKPPTKA